MHWTQQHRHWLTYLSWAPWKNVQAHMKQPIATSERRQFASLQGIRQIYTYVYIYIYMYEAAVWLNRRVRKCQNICTIWNPPVVSWFINPINYSYMMLYVSQTIVIGVISVRILKHQLPPAPNCEPCTELRGTWALKGRFGTSSPSQPHIRWRNRQNLAKSNGPKKKGWLPWDHWSLREKPIIFIGNLWKTRLQRQPIRAVKHLSLRFWKKLPDWHIEQLGLFGNV